MSSFPTVAFAQSGPFGNRLFEDDNPVFVIASTSIDEGTAQEVLRDLPMREGRIDYKRLWKNSRNRTLLSDAVNHPALNTDTGVAIMIHKPYVEMTRMIESVYFPLARARNIETFDEEVASDVVNGICRDLAQVIGFSRLNRFFAMFNKYRHNPSSESFEKMSDEAHAIFARVKNSEFLQFLWIPLMMALDEPESVFNEWVVEPEGSDTIADDAAPAVAYARMFAKWAFTFQEPFTVVTGRSDVLERSAQEILDDFMPFALEAVVEAEKEEGADDVDIDELHFPEIAFAEDPDHPRLQVAELLANVVAVLSEEQVRGRSSGRYYELAKRTLRDDWISAGGLWPNQSPE